jgi:hypothetical protein
MNAPDESSIPYPSFHALFSEEAVFISFLSLTVEYRAKMYSGSPFGPAIYSMQTVFVCIQCIDM